MDQQAANNTNSDAQNVDTRSNNTGTKPDNKALTGKFLTIVAEYRELSAEEMEFRRKTLKKAVILIATMKIFSLPFYVILFYLIHNRIHSEAADVIKIMTIAAGLPQSVNIIILFVGAIKEKLYLIESGACLTILMALYHTVLGMMGAIYFCSFGLQGYTLCLCIAYAITACSLIMVVCHDFIIIYGYKILLPPQRGDAD